MTKSFSRCPCELLGNPECTHPQLFYRGVKNPKILIIGEFPSLQEDRTGKLGSSYNNKTICNLLKINNVDLKTVGFTNVLSCFPGNTKPQNYHYSPCVRKLKELLKEKSSSVELIFLVGEVPLRKVLGKIGISKNRGKIFKIGTAHVISLYSPSKCKNSKIKKRALELDIKRGIAATHETTTEIKWEMVNADKLKQLIPEIKRARKLTIDTETTGLSTWEDQFYTIGVGFCWNGLQAKGIFLPLEHPQLLITAEEYQNRIDVLKQVLALPLPKEMFNGEYDLKVLSVGLDIDLYDIKNYCKDPLHAAHLLDCNTLASLSNLTLERLPNLAGYDAPMEIIKSKYSGESYMERASLEDIAKYCVGDCICTYRIGEMLEDELKSIGSYDLYTNLVVPSSKIYTLLSIRGVKIDQTEAIRLQKEYRKKIEVVERELLELPAVKEWEKESGEKLSLTSSKQKMDMIYSYFGIPEETTKRKDDKGKVKWTRSLDKECVRKIWKHNGEDKYSGKIMDFIEKLEQFSQLNTIESRYTGKWEKHIHTDGLIHARLNNRGTRSGRLSMTKPNLQQMPTRIDTEDKELAEWLTENAVKKMLVSRHPNGWLVDADQSQLELRLMAALSSDEIMVGTYRDNLNGGDIHRATALRKFPTFDSQPQKIQESLRVKAKTINFKGAYSFDPEFLEVYPGLAEYVKKTKNLAIAQGYVYDLCGRRRIIDDLGLDVPTKRVYTMSDGERENYFVRESALRAAVNHTVQGLAHELIEDSLIRIDKRLHDLGIAEIVMETHDSLTADVPLKENVKIVGRIMKEEMENIVERYDWLVVPLVAEIKIGRNWWEMEKLDLTVNG